ncbi:hypothetical protein KBK19_11235 [Microvirga sp. STR05]|uniref:Spi protease inhibitor domain-containing protein n=1 Tax=Hymenobacter duratus TaxID=2771356 RepID=A0ABR8JFG0_9BACT|nr:hypothetical protein [Hymenobacter duratus]MBD2715611.1 hypothetical protein [Hymenobacter duratus]MBR7950519.1 hypothetical protein [Microvirga sp. STR05]
MKPAILSLLAAGLFLTCLPGCQEQQNAAAPNKSVVQDVASAGQQISLDQAVALTLNYRSHYPGSLRAVAYSAQGIQSLLSQEGCTGIRIYNATTDAGEDLFVLVGVDAAGHDQTTAGLLDAAPRCPVWCAASVLVGDVSGFSAATAPVSIPLTQEQAVRWTGTYQYNHPGQLRGAYYEAAILEELIRQNATTGIRIYHALTHNDEHTFVLVGIDGNYQDQVETSHHLYANGLPCVGSGCASGSLLAH